MFITYWNEQFGICLVTCILDQTVRIIDSSMNLIDHSIIFLSNGQILEERDNLREILDSIKQKDIDEFLPLHSTKITALETIIEKLQLQMLQISGKKSPSRY